jgi:TIR domain/NACHT domain
MMNVFISYTRAGGLELAAQLEDALRGEGYDTWRDVRNLDPFQDCYVEIEDAIERATHVVVLLTPDLPKNTHSFVRREIAAACYARKKIIPLLVNGFPVEDIPIQINTLTWIVFHDFASGFRQLRERLQWTDADSMTLLPDNNWLSATDDPYARHALHLRDYAVQEMRQRIGHGRGFVLRLAETPNAVHLPQAFLSAGVSDDPTQSLSGDEPLQDFSDFSKALRHYRGRLLVLGAPGAGKTTALLTFARELAYSRLELGTSAYLPIFARIRDWDGYSDLTDWLARYNEIDRYDLSELISSKRAFLLLDGLDEAALSLQLGKRPGTSDSIDMRLGFMRAVSALPETPVVVTCRQLDYEDIVHKAGRKIGLNGAITIKPLTDFQIKTVLADRPELLTALQMDENLMDLARSPLTLSMLMVAFRTPEAARELAALVRQPDNLERRFVQLYIQQRYQHEHLRRKGDYPTLEVIYNGLGQAVEHAATKAIHEQIEEMEEQLKAKRMFPSTQMDSKNFWEFCDLLISLVNDVRRLAQEIDMAPAIREVWSIDDRIPPSTFRELDMEALLRCAIDLQILKQDNDEQYRFVHSVLREEVTMQHLRSVASRRDQKLKERGGAILIASLVLGVGAADALYEITKADEAEVLPHVAFILAVLGDARALPLLIRAANLPNSDSRMAAIFGFLFLPVEDGEVREKRFETLKKLLNDESHEVRADAAYVLGFVGESWAAPLLLSIKFKSDEHSEVHKRAGHALMTLGLYLIPPVARRLSRLPQWLLVKMLKPPPPALTKPR